MSGRLRCITDTNVWIDLHVGGLLDSVFELDAEWLIPDFVQAELGSELEELLVEWGLRVQSLSGEQVLELIELNRSYPAPSPTDMSTLVLARSLGGTLVTGDAALRSAAKAEDIEVHGTLWIADMLVENSIIMPHQAARALQLMMQDDRRLPKRETNKRIQSWSR